MSRGNLCVCCLIEAPVVVKRSRLVASQRYPVCDNCKTHDLRSVIVLCGRTNGIQYISRQLAEDLYCGKPILAKDLV